MATLKLDFSTTGIQDLKVKMVPIGVDPSKVNAVNVNTFYWRQNHPRATPTSIYSRGSINMQLRFDVCLAEPPPPATIRRLLRDVVFVIPELLVRISEAL